MVPGRRYNARYLLRTLRRSWWMLLGPLAITGTLAVLVARALPDVYYAQGAVRIVPPRVSEAYVKGALGMGIPERVATARAHVLAPERLKAMIAELDLYPAIRHRVPEDVLLTWLRSSIRINLVSAEIYTVGYFGYSKQRVQKVAERLTTQMVEETEKQRAAFSDNRGQFLETELEGARKRLEEHEQKVSDYRRRYAGQLPTQVDANLKMMQSTGAELQSAEDALTRDRTRREELNRELEAASPTAPPAAVTGDGLDAEIPDPPAGDVTATLPPGPPSQQLRQLRALRARWARRLTPEHPDMQALDRSIGQLERAAAAAAANPGAPAGAAGDPASRVDQLRGAIKALDTQIAAREATSKKLRDALAAYRNRVDLVPEREAEWLRLTRDYNTLQGVYSGLLAKREEARIASNVDRHTVGEQVRVIDAPKRPANPVSPNRRKVVLLGVGLGIGLGVGLLLLRELRDRTIRTEEEVLAALNLPVVGLVPSIVTAVEQRQLRRRRLLWSFAAVVVCAGLAALKWNG
jgi:polysaccharide chain length determinant protein (PEP-CTERM system associated)